MGNEQTALSFGKGITNVPSDAICDDNALEECMGMVFDDGEHRVIQKPVEFMTGAPTVLYIHKVNGIENFICYKEVISTGNTAYQLAYGSSVNGSYIQTDVFSVDGNPMTIDPPSLIITSNGKTLIVNTGDRIEYFLWKHDAGKYECLGEIPEPNLKIEAEVGALHINNGMHADCFVIYSPGSGTTAVDNQETYNNLVIGLYSKLKREISEDSSFCEPFFVRYALELFDGTYTKVSIPYLMLPFIRHNLKAQKIDDRVRFEVKSARLVYRAVFDYTKWGDIVKDVVVFASEGVSIYDTTGDQNPTVEVINIDENNHRVFSLYDGIDRDLNSGRYNYYINTYADTSDNTLFYALNKKSDNEIVEDLQKTSNFYKLSSLGVVKNTQWSLLPIKPHTVTNLTTQVELPDDYYSNCPLSSKNMISYNYRLLLSNVLRGFYDGAGRFLLFDNLQEYSYRIYVYIHSGSGERIVCKEVTTAQKMDWYFYYPDPRAFKALIFMDDGNGNYVLFKELKLTESPYLNGAYFYKKDNDSFVLPDGTETDPTPATGEDLPTEPTAVTTPEELQNQIWLSEVNNPFVFRAEGNVSVGSGDILGISSLTQALSQGQFGQYPLIVFTDEGIWAASTNSTGLISAIHPMSREVCNSPASITQTDGAVFFSSEKGLMVVVGSTVKCVSEQLAGKSEEPFSLFLRTAHIAYDYRDSLLWIFDGASSVCWIYNIKSGTFAHYDFGTGNVVTNVVNDYPDYLLQIGSSIYSLLRRPNINDDGVTVNSVFTANTYSGQIITRPMKFDNALALKSIRQIMTVKQMEGSMTYRLFASNDLQSWVELSSLRGMPWKYYKLQFDFSRLKATDRFGGAVIVTQERRTNKLR